MLKTRVGDTFWLVQQHHHAQVSGYLAAHWGNDAFAMPGGYPGGDPGAAALWRESVVLGIAEHDNGWWETEAMPKINEPDGLPVGLGEKAKPVADNGVDQWRAGGFERWRIGIDRLGGPHPYAALLISLHAYWLYAVAYEDLVAEAGDLMRHFIFTGRQDSPDIVGDRDQTRRFLDEQAEVQRGLMARLDSDARWAGATEPAHLAPHLRLLQLMDTMSLYLSMNDLGDHDLPDVPRASWDDRVTVRWCRTDARTVRLDPYPFAMDPLPVFIPTRVVEAEPAHRPAHMRTPYAALHGSALESIGFTLSSV